MTENNQEQKKTTGGEPIALNPEQAEAAKKLAANLVKDETHLDIGSLFRMANNLLNDESLLGMVEEIGKRPEKAEKTTAENKGEEDSGKGASSENKNLASLKMEMEELRAELKKTQKEVAELKKQNASLLNLFLKVVNAANQDLKKSVGLLTGLSKLLK